MSHDPTWLPCTACGEVKPILLYIGPTKDKPYCHDCGPHALEIEVFPMRLTGESPPLERRVTEGPKYDPADYEGGINCPLCNREPEVGAPLAHVMTNYVGNIPANMVVCGPCGKREDIFEAVETVE